MTQPAPILLMTRPQAASERFFAQLPADVRRRVKLCVSPLIEIVPTGEEIAFGSARGVIFTSANGVAVASDRSRRRDLPVYCVGHATTRAAAEAGWQARCLGETVEEVFEALRAAGHVGPLLHLGGVHVRGRLAERLTATGCATERKAVYDQVLRPLSDEASEGLSGETPVVVPLFSPRTARQFADQCPRTARPQVIALSPAVAEALSLSRDMQVRISDRPDAASMVDSVENTVKRFCRVESDGGAQ